MTLLAVRDLSVAFGGIRALDAASFTAEAGAITALIGPNGAGKTTLVNCVTGMVRPDSGSVTFDGRDITGMAAHRLPRLGLSRTFQHLRVFGSMNLLENVMVGLHGHVRTGMLSSMLRLPGVRRTERAMRDAAMQALDFTGLSDRADEPAGLLPYGDQKRLVLARALVGDPRMILLDEPVAGLNPAETHEMGGLILALRARGVAVLLIEHDMSLVMRVSDAVVVLCSGAKIAEGAPGEVKRNPEVVNAYLGGGEEFGLHA
ncbi:MAG TPA: ABC transporter ATP-binding protein [Nitratidesulfovibrio sp.]|nr:ABC transporter ATP-binding protein [Nitratidesulfovibrio sp.]